MASISSDDMTRPPIEPYLRLLTVADLAAMPGDLPSGDVKYELDNGRLIVTPPPGSEHGLIQGEFAAQLVTFAKQHSLGRVWVDCGVILWRDPDRCVGPDICFVAQHRLPPKLSREGYLETIPDLVVEVRSKNDTKPYLKRKAHDYLKAGVRLVWVVEPQPQKVTEYRPDVAPQTFGISETLACDDILPGFRLPLAELFRT
jgi:Uma2 family endonuclease